MRYVVHGTVDGTPVQISCRDAHAAHDLYGYLVRRFDARVDITPEVCFVLLSAWPLYVAAGILGVLFAIV